MATIARICESSCSLPGNCDQQLQQLGAQWDSALDHNDEAGKAAAKGALVALLNRRNYVRNLVRDVQSALGE